MEETVGFNPDVGKRVFVYIVLGILGILMALFLGTNQRGYTVGGERMRERISPVLEDKEVVFNGVERGKRETQDNWDLILKEVLPPGRPVADQLLTDASIPEKPGLLPESAIEKPESGILLWRESATSESSGIEISVEQKVSDEQNKVVLVIPEVPNEWNPAESVVPGVPDKPMTPTVPDEPVAPVIPEEPTIPIVPDEPVAPVVPGEPTIPIVPEEPSDPVIPDVEAPDPVIPIDPVVPDSDTPPPDVGEETNVCFLMDEAGILIGFHPEYAEIEKGCLFLPESCTGIKKDVFSGCGAGIKELYIPNGTTYIEEGALAGLQELEWIEVGWENPVYLGEEGVLFDGSRSLLLAFPNGRTGTYLIPAGVLRIAGGAFAETSISRLDARDCGVLQFGEAVFGSSNGNGIRITVPKGTCAAYEAALAGYAVVIKE